MNNQLELSIIIPASNEEGNLRPLIEGISKSCQSYSFEVLIIDDGSTDSTLAEALQLSKNDQKIRVIKLRKRFGQTAALAAGIDHAQSPILVTIDGDGQNDPQDIPNLIQELKKGYDVVSGWREHRKDSLITRKIPSWCANAIISWVTGISLHDYGCTLKAYRASLIKDIEMFGEMHRFLPAWCAWRGGKITEIPVRHYARKRGHSKYGILRIFKVLIDLMTLKFFSGYLFKPNHLFSGSAFFFFGLSLLSGGLAFYDKFGPDRFASYRIPLLLLAGILGVVSILLILLGFVTELMVRLYFSIRDQKPYIIDHENEI
ncbi:hypothetical protein BVX98_03180 [bacterium F11]|nr:hypothetical protein BVX98_03180 [bacterium F11]